MLLLAILIGFLLLLFPLVAEQSITIAATLPGNYQSLRDWMVNNSNQLIASLGRFLPLTYAGLPAAQLTGQGILNSAGEALSLVNGITQFVFYAVIILTFHWTLDGPRSVQSLLQ